MPSKCHRKVGAKNEIWGKVYWHEEQKQRNSWDPKETKWQNKEKRRNIN